MTSEETVGKRPGGCSSQSDSPGADGDGGLGSVQAAITIGHLRSAAGAEEAGGGFR